MIQVMVRYRSSMALRPVHRIKHVVDASQTMTAGTQVTNNLVKTVDAPVLANTTEVETGCKINGIYLRAECASTEADVGAIPNVYMMVTKNPGNAITFPNANAVGSSDDKRYVIHQEMIMLNNVVSGNPRTLFNGVIVIPKGYRRMGPNDHIKVSFFNPAVNIAVCLQAHYKEFR